jgi:hypothetical protein
MAARTLKNELEVGNSRRTCCSSAREEGYANGLRYLEAKPEYNDENYVLAARHDDENVKQGDRRKFHKMKLTPFFMARPTGMAGDNLLKMGR